jgi:hypothetical protein
VPGKKSSLTPLGRVSNPFTNYLAVLAVDARHAGAWPGSDRALKGMRSGRWPSEIPVGEATGIIAEIGGCGGSEVFRADGALVMVEYYTGDDDADTEAELERAIVSTTRSPKRLGVVDVQSGVLAFIAISEAGEEPSAKTLAAAKKGSAKAPFGVFVGVKAGRYAVWRESLELEGPWGFIGNRVRVVAEGQPVTAGKPIATLAPPPPKRKATAGERRVVDGWTAVSSMAIAPDGRAFAGENGGFRACGFDATGARRWQRQLAKTGDEARYNYELSVQLVGDELLAHAKDSATLHVLAPDTGKTVRTVSIRAARLPGDARRRRAGAAHPDGDDCARLPFAAAPRRVRGLLQPERHRDLRRRALARCERARSPHLRSRDAEARCYLPAAALALGHVLSAHRRARHGRRPRAVVPL